jgi:hypothetical protein
MTTTPSNPNQAPGLTPDSLVNQLFDVALMQSTTKNPHEIAQQVIDFLGAALVYALTSSKRDVVVFLTETLIYVVSASSVDENARKEMLKQVGETILSAGSKPMAGKP